MRKLITTAFCLLLVTPALAEQWQYEGGATPIAYIDNGPAQFQFACRGGQLAMGFWVREPDETVAKAMTMSLAITPDPASGSRVASESGTSFAQDMPLVHLEGASVIVRGPVARQWARIAQGARADLRVAFVRLAGSGLEAFDPMCSGPRARSRQLRRCWGNAAREPVGTQGKGG